jgi:SAM-dependent methyltransferase
MIRSKLDNNEIPSDVVIQCPLCFSTQSQLLFWNFDRLYGFKGDFALIECNNCKLVRLSPRPNKDFIQSYYPSDDYYSYQVATGSINDISNRNFLGKAREKLREIVLGSMGYPSSALGSVGKLVEPLIVKLFFAQATYGWGNKFPNYVKDGSALDVGSGNGRYLSFLKHHGWRVKGNDFSRTAADFARAAFDIEVHVGSFEESPYEAESFDYINLSHVVEHTFDPVKTMKLVFDLLKPGGRAYIEVPNFDSFSRRRSGAYWYPWETPRHLFMFSPENLMLLIEQCGLKVEKIKTENGNFWAWDKTYKLEEQCGERLETRPVNRVRYKPIFTVMRTLSAINRFIKPMNGDFICCWVKK